MKTSSKYIVFACALSILIALTPGASASGNLELDIEANSRVIHMKMAGTVSETMDLILFNEQNQVIYEDKLDNASRFEHSYDFSGYEEGTYTLVLEKENMNFHRVLNVHGSGVTLADSYFTFRPVFRMIDGKVLVHYINNGQREIGISIERNTETLFENYYGDEAQIFTETFALENLESGIYTLHFATQGEFHAFDFKVD